MKRRKTLSTSAKRKIAGFKTKLREFRVQKPFQPFQIVTKDGRRFIVVKPLWFGFGGDTVGVMPDGDLNHFMKFDEVDSVELLK